MRTFGKKTKRSSSGSCCKFLFVVAFMIGCVESGNISSSVAKQQQQQQQQYQRKQWQPMAFSSKTAIASSSTTTQPIIAAAATSSIRRKRDVNNNKDTGSYNISTDTIRTKHFLTRSINEQNQERDSKRGILSSSSSSSSPGRRTYNNDLRSKNRTRLRAASTSSTSVASTTTTIREIKTSVSKFVQSNFLVCGMAIAVTFAKLFPSLGASKTLAEYLVSKIGVFLVFLISGWSLELNELKDALMQMKLNTFIQALNFVAWPYCVGLPITFFFKTFIPNALPKSVLDGILILTCLPTTVNMCIFLTQASGGNVACALCNAVIGNTLGIFITPALLLRFFGTNIKLPFIHMVSKLVSKVLVPVIIGQTLRQNTKLKQFYQTNSKTFKKINELALISIVWTSFCNAFAQGVGLDPRNVMVLLLLLPMIHVLSVLGLFTIFQQPSLRLSRKDIVAATFTSSHKTLAFGLPLIKTVFDGNTNLASYCAPVMLIHPIQLVLGSFMVPQFNKYINAQNDQGGISTPTLKTTTATATISVKEE